MQTTLDIDQDALERLESVSLATSKSAGKLVSELLRLHLPNSSEYTVGADGITYRNGFAILPSRGGVVTSEMVRQIMEETEDQ